MGLCLHHRSHRSVRAGRHPYEDQTDRLPDPAHRPGCRGSGPGKFGVPKGVALDGKGGIYVVDILRRKVLVFDDQSLSFRYEFGRLVAPQEVAVGADGRVYVSQNARKGVAVYNTGVN